MVTSKAPPLASLMPWASWSSATSAADAAKGCVLAVGLSRDSSESAM